MLRFLGVLVVVAALCAPAVAAPKRLHTYFLFAFNGGRSLSVETAVAEADLGRADGWSCKASPIKLTRRSTYGTIHKEASITCVLGTTGVEVEVGASCDVAAETRNSGRVLFRARADAFQLWADVYCETRSE
jgi:hypothetical protein